MERIPLIAWLLNLAYIIVVSLVLPYRVLVRRRSFCGWREKLLGRVPRRAGQGRCLWLHAVSVGEVLQLQPVIDALAHSEPDLELVISTTTATGFDVARARYSRQTVFYFPLDFSWAVNAALSRINPTAIALVELELWPNFVFAAAKRRIPLALVNGRISERSFHGYRRVRSLIRAVLSKIDLLAVQSETYAARLAALGTDRARIHVTGSIKFDRVETNRGNDRTIELGRLFGIDDHEMVFVAGSTQDPEERLAIESYLQLRLKYPDLRLMLVPRHKERFDEVARLVRDEFGLDLIRRSELDPNFRGDKSSSNRHPPPACVASLPEPSASAAPIVLLDTLGELSACWGLATIAFVGGSLTRRGGQNMIEPAGYGAAVLFGPNTWNFKDVVDLLLGQNAALVVHSGAELTDRLDELLFDRDKTTALGGRARRLVTAQRGATARTVDLLRTLLTAAGATASSFQAKSGGMTFVDGSFCPDLQ
jgi:3-deoxy-D-manno-octulosonic-acid transferase